MAQGTEKFDIDKAYKAMVKSATTPGESNAMRPDIDPYAARGYIPVGHYAGDLSGDNSVSHALEYYVADAALAWLARRTGDIGTGRLAEPTLTRLPPLLFARIRHTASHQRRRHICQPVQPARRREFQQCRGLSRRIGMELFICRAPTMWKA